jgi:glucokinase
MEGMEARLGVGVDLGATRVRVCVGDSNGNVAWKTSRRMPLPERVEGYVEQIVCAVEEAASRVPRTSTLAGIGVASAGPLDLKRGGMASPANLPYKFVPLVGPLQEKFGVGVVLMNDCNAAVLGEKRFGGGKGHENLVYVTLSTGIGGGAIVDGHLLIGKDGNAAEVGHLVVDPARRLTCGCGRKGHWEAYCSGKNIPKLAMLLAHEEQWAKDAENLGDLLNTCGPVDSAVILRAAAEGNRFGMRVAEEMGKLNALGFANAVNLFDPSLITIGGGVALNNEKLVLRPITELVPEYSINRMPVIMITPLGDDVGLLGALSLAFHD